MAFPQITDRLWRSPMEAKKWPYFVSFRYWRSIRILIIP